VTPESSLTRPAYAPSELRRAGLSRLRGRSHFGAAEARGERRLRWFRRHSPPVARDSPPL